MNRMKWPKRLVGALLALVLGLALAVPAFAVPIVPLTFTGDVTIDGVDAPIGTDITAEIEAAEVASTITTIAGRYVISIDYDSSYIGKTVVLKVNDAYGGEGTYVDPSGTPVVTVNLAITGVPVTYYTLTVTVSPSGGGTVSRNPADQDPTTPGYQYEDGTTVTLTATPASDYEFNHWSGDASGTSATTSVLMTGNKSVTAHFSSGAPPPPPPHSGSVGGTAYLPNKAAIVAPWIALGAALMAVLGWLMVRRRRASG